MLFVRFACVSKRALEPRKPSFALDALENALDFFKQIRAFCAVKCKKCNFFLLYIEKYNTALHCTCTPIYTTIFIF